MHQSENVNQTPTPAPSGDGQPQQTGANLENQLQERTEQPAEATVAHQAEVAALRRSGAETTRFADHLHTLLESTGEGIYGIDSDGLCTFINRAGAQMLGYRPEEVLGQEMHALTHHHHADGSPYPTEECPIAQAFRQGQPCAVDDETLWRKDGTSFPVRCASYPILRDGVSEGAVVTFHDITEQKQHLEELRESEARTRAVIETSLDCIITIDADGKVVEFNAAAEETFGYSRDEVLGRELAELIIPPAWREDHRRGLAQHAVTGDGPVLNRRIEMRAMRANGEEFPVELAVTRTRVSGRPLFTASLRDLTERKFHEATQSDRVRLAALVQDVSLALTRGDHLRDMLRACTDALVRHLEAAFARIWTLNEAENVLELCASSGMYTHTNGPHGRVPVGQFKIGHIAARRQPHLTNAVQTDPHVSNQEWARREGMVAFAGYPLIVDDRLVGVMAMFARQPLSQVVLQGMASVASGIALGVQRKRTEQSLRASEELFRQLADSIPQMAWMAHPDGSIFWYNRRWYEYTGTSPVQMEGWGWQSVHDPVELPRVLDGYKAAFASGQPWEDTFPLRRHDGAMRWHLSRAVPLRDAEGRIVRWFGTNTDITERLQMEDDLRQARDDLEARVRERTAELAATNIALERSNRELEQFAYVASHDLQEPLRKIQAFGDRLTGKYRDQLGEQGTDYLRRMQAAAGRMRTLIEDLLMFSRLATRLQPFRPVDLTEVAREVASDLEERIQQTDGTVEIGTLPTLEADPLQMRQLLQNLIGNGLKFHKPDVPPLVRVEARLRDAIPDVPAGGRSGPWCELTVTDNGIGFEQVYAERIFQIFQRLHGRTEYEGTGIGLAVCRKIVERHGGSITATSQPGHGTTFTVRLPVKQQTDLAIGS